MDLQNGCFDMQCEEESVYLAFGSSDNIEEEETWEDLLEMEENAWDPSAARREWSSSPWLVFQAFMSVLHQQTHSLLGSCSWTDGGNTLTI